MASGRRSQQRHGSEGTHGVLLTAGGAGGEAGRRDPRRRPSGWQSIAGRALRTRSLTDLPGGRSRPPPCSSARGRGCTRRPVVGRVHVALAAGRPLAPVRARVDREVAPVVVEARGRPGRRRVAALALGGEARGLVVGVGGARVVRLVAGVAVRRRARVAAARVALRAGHAGRGRRSGGSASCCGRSSPASRRSCCGRSGTGSGSRRPVVRVGGAGVVGLVAGVAVRGRARVAAARRGTARSPRVTWAPVRGKRGLVVVELRRPPGVDRVAALAGGREVRRRRGWGSSSAA